MVGRKRNEILVVGLSFAAAVFVTYFLVGLGLFRFIETVADISQVADIIFGGTALLCLIFGIVSIADYFKARSGRIADMSLQLPKFLKLRIHKTIRERARTESIIAGALFAHWIGFINAEQFSFTESILYVGMIIIGGLGTNIGPIFGVVFIRILQQLLTEELVPFLESTFTMFPSGFASGVTPMLFGLFIVLFLILEPRGLAHRWALFKAAYRLWPFSY